MKNAKEVRAMHEDSARTSLSSESPPAVKERSPLRIKFDTHLYLWSDARPDEAKRLANKLAIWASAFPESGTLWTLIEEKLILIYAEKSAMHAGRPHDNEARKAAKAQTARETPEKVVEWLFEAPTADEFMYRLTRRF